eukprot:7591199-Ditylum_brightwellii.AAC.1
MQFCSVGGSVAAVARVLYFTLPSISLHRSFSALNDIHARWIPSGEAFHILDLNHLKNKTLPSFFQHSRFQSLHPLFHRDHELHKLRRRFCPGVDGQKQCGNDFGFEGNRGIGSPVPSDEGFIYNAEMAIDDPEHGKLKRQHSYTWTGSPKRSQDH